MDKRRKTISILLKANRFESLTSTRQATGQANRLPIRFSKPFRCKLYRERLVIILAALILSSGLFGLVRAAAGDLDPTFGSGGKVTTDFFAGQCFARDVAVQADGKIIAVGDGAVIRGMRIEPDFMLARYNPDGSLDATFGSGGKVSTDFSSGDTGRAVALQSDGKIIVAGSERLDLTTVDNNFALVRYNPDGSLDPTFGSGGKVSTGFAPGSDDQALALAIQANGKIVAAGLSNSGLPTGSDFALVRYNADGSLDPTFGSGGKLTTDFSSMSDKANGVAIQSDGKIVAGGGAQIADFGLARYNPDGSLDTTFGSGGKVTTDFFSGFDEINALAIQSDGKVLTAGYALAGVGNYNFALARYNADGSLDSAFGSGGKVTTDFFASNDFAIDVAIQFNGKIIAVGQATTATNQDFVLVRYNPDGTPDSSFGTGGKVTTGFSASSGDSAQAVALQSDGRIIAAGDTTTPTTSNIFALARYLGDVPPCSLTCPPNIALSNSPGQCGAVVNYAPVSSGGCGPIACSPASGAFFPVGTTTVTCEPAAGPACSFTVMVADTQAPTVNCPANLTMVSAPGSAGAVVNFPSPGATDNCPGVTTLCSPPSGATFPVGTSTVNCTAQDTAGNTTACSFTVTVFDVCLQDDANPQTVLFFDSRTGDYRFCCSGRVLTGRGIVSIRGGTITLEHNTSDRRVTGRLDSAVNRGSATIQSSPGMMLCTISDRDTRNNSCSCR